MHICYTLWRIFSIQGRGGGSATRSKMIGSTFLASLPKSETAGVVEAVLHSKKECQAKLGGTGIFFCLFFILLLFLHTLHTL